MTDAAGGRPLRRRALIALLLAVLAAMLLPRGALATAGPGRQALQQAAQASALQAYFAAHAATFAGSFIDEGGDHLVVRFTDPPSAHTDLRSAFAYPDALQVEQAPYSLAELQGLVAEINNAIGDLRAQGVDVVSVGVDQTADRVGVRVSTSLDAARAVLGARFDAARLVVQHGQPFVAIDGRTPVGAPRGFAAWQVIALSAAAAGCLALAGRRLVRVRRRAA